MKFINKKAAPVMGAAFCLFPLSRKVFLQIRYYQFLVGMDDIWIA